MKLDLEAVRYIIDTAKLAGLICQECDTHEDTAGATVTLRFLQEEKPTVLKPQVDVDELARKISVNIASDQPERVKIFDTLDD